MSRSGPLSVMILIRQTIDSEVIATERAFISMGDKEADAEQMQEIYKNALADHGRLAEEMKVAQAVQMEKWLEESRNADERD